MSRSISDSMMSQLSAFLRQQTGLVFPPERWSELERAMISAAREFGFSETGACIRWLMSAPLKRRQIETLAGFLTVGETYFYRDPRILEITGNEILPEIIKRRRGIDQRLRIWSAACSTGEEPYSLAILLQRLLPDLADWNITILATDINPASLQKGRGGVFGRWSFRNTPSWFQTLYFTADNDRFRVRESVRRMVSFEYLNLAEDSYPSLPTNTNAMDLIFCRNVLIYFDDDTARRVVGKLNHSLVEGGWLVVGPAEAVPRGYPGYQPVSFDGATCYRKKAPALFAPADLVEAWLPVTAAAPAAAQAERPTGDQAPPVAEGGGPSPDPALQEAAELYRKGLYQQAAALLGEPRRRALLGEPRRRALLDRDAIALLIRAEANQGRLAEAARLCEEALGDGKLDPALHFLRAEILQEQGLLSEAQLALQRALYLDPKLVLAHFALGNLALSSGKGDRARKHFDNALALLDAIPFDEILPGSEGMTAGRLREVILTITGDAGRAGGGRP
jgi:chemotaxis protein methyltransferase CheR